MTSRIKLKIITEEPVIIPLASGDPNTVETQTFIPGAALLGSFAGIWLKNNKYPAAAETNEEFRKFFLDNKVRWHNALPRIGNGSSAEDSRVIPFCIQKTTDGEIYNTFHEDFDVDEVKIKSLSGFGRYAQDSVEINNVRKCREFHILKSQEKGEGTIFHYEFIPAGVEFSSEISGDASTLNDLYNTFSACKKIFIGRSKGAQYGAISLEWNNPEEINFKLPSEDNDWLIVLESDVILLNENGYPESSIALLEKELGLCKIEKVNIKTGSFEGFNAKRQAFRPGGTAIKAGSCIKVKVAENCENKALLLNAVNSGIGQRCSEGYGCISVVINPDCELTELQQENYSSEDLSEEDRKSGRPLVEKILMEEILRQAAGAAFTRAKLARINASPSSLSRVLVFLMNMEKWNSTEFENNFLDRLKSKARKQLEDSFVENSSLWGYLINNVPYEPKAVFCECLKKYGADMENIRAKAGLVFLKTLFKALRKSAKGGRK